MSSARRPVFHRFRTGGSRLVPVFPFFLLFLHASAVDALASKLSPATVKAWDQYLLWVEKRVATELSSPQGFLLEDFLPPQEKASVKSQLESGKIVVRRMTSPVPKAEHLEVPDGEIHHWWGGILVPGIKMPELLKFLQDYDHHQGRFVDVEKSRLIARDGNHFRFFLRLRRSKAFVTAYYNTEQECSYVVHSPSRVSSHSTATRIAEIADPGTTAEKERPPGDDRGFLWRLESWWRFEQTDRGVIVEVESASLSRDIPTWVKFIPGVSSYIRSTPRESLESLLTTIRDYPKSANPSQAKSAP